MKQVGVLRNPIQPYQWGSRTALAELLGRPSPAPTPQAELWMGAHPKAPSEVLVGGTWRSLLTLVGESPEDILGRDLAERFARRFPLLFKILAVAKPLSLQAHPDRERAEQGFAREEAMGIPMEAAHRNYRDRSHKPEMLFPLTPFWALIGFRSLNDILERWKAIGPTAALVRFREKPDPENLRGFFLTLLTLPQARQEALISEALSSTARHRRFDPISAWVCRLQEDHPGQVGVLAPLFLNLVRLEPGQAVYLPPGELHAYLEGMALELSANSDNVLRGGLTPKHVDVPELLRVVTFTERQVQVLQPRALASGEIVYPAPAGEFRLSVISLEEDRPYEGEETRGVEILICTQGEARVIELSERKVTPLPRGTSVIVPAAAGRYVLEGRALLYKATVPL